MFRMYLGESFSRSRYARNLRTVAGLFDLIQEAIDQGAYSISVVYHPDLGYPASLGIDYDRRIADEEVGFRVSGVSELE